MANRTCFSDVYTPFLNTRNLQHSLNDNKTKINKQQNKKRWGERKIKPQTQPWGKCDN